MKSVLITAITFYQAFISPIFKQLLGVRSQCRYSPTCSAYAKKVISEYGVIKGMQLATRRLLSCQPFSQNYGNI